MGGKIRGPRTVLEEKLILQEEKEGKEKGRNRARGRRGTKRHEKAEEHLGVSAGQED